MFSFPIYCSQFISIVLKTHSVNFFSFSDALWDSSCNRKLSSRKCCTSAWRLALSSFSWGMRKRRRAQWWFQVTFPAFVNKQDSTLEWYYIVLFPTFIRALSALTLVFLALGNSRPMGYVGDILSSTYSFGTDCWDFSRLNSNIKDSSPSDQLKMVTICSMLLMQPSCGVTAEES